MWFVSVLWIKLRECFKLWIKFSMDMVMVCLEWSQCMIFCVDVDIRYYYLQCFWRSYSTVPIEKAGIIADEKCSIKGSFLLAERCYYCSGGTECRVLRLRGRMRGKCTTWLTSSCRAAGAGTAALWRQMKRSGVLLSRYTCREKMYCIKIICIFTYIRF